MAALKRVLRLDKDNGQEELDPPAPVAALAARQAPVDGGILAPVERAADGEERLSDDAPRSEKQGNRQSAQPSVTVLEGVDRLEPVMGDGKAQGGDGALGPARNRSELSRRPSSSVGGGREGARLIR